MCIGDNGFSCHINSKLFFALACCLFIVIERHYRKQHDTSVTHQCGHEKDPLIRSEFRMIDSILN